MFDSRTRRLVPLLKRICHFYEPFMNILYVHAMAKTSFLNLAMHMAKRSVCFLLFGRQKTDLRAEQKDQGDKEISSFCFSICMKIGSNL